MAEGPRIGKDEWVARSGENIERHRVVRVLDRVPGWARLALFVAAVASIPLITDDGYINVVVFDTLIFCLLAIGLNVVVGWGGLLDLGYIAFFGVGAYTYAILSSDKFDIHLSSLLVMVICVVLGALLGLLVGLPSWRLSGDYLAIVTLFVYQIFISIVTNGHDLFGVDLTGGRQRHRELRPVRPLRPRDPGQSPGDLQLELRLHRTRRLRRRLRRALPREQLAHRAGLARAS